MPPLPSSRRFNPGDYKGMPEIFLGRFLSSLNLFTEPVFAILQKGLNFYENFNAQVYPFQIVGGATASDNILQFKSTVQGRVRALELCSVNESNDPTAPVTNAVGFSWYTDSGNIYITAIAGLTAGTTYTILVRAS